MTIAGCVAMRDTWHNGDGLWHLVDVATWPLVTVCGDRAPAPMARQVKAPRFVAVDDACPDCLVKSAARSVDWKLRGTGT